MKKRPEFDQYKSTHSSYKERSLISYQPESEKPSQFLRNSHRPDSSDSMDTCNFPLFPFGRLIEVACQTDSLPCLDPLILENKKLSAQVTCLRQELDDLKSSVHDLLDYKKLLQIQANEELIQLLISETASIEDSLGM